MDDIWTLILLSTAMLVGCYLAGIIPLAINFSEDKLKLVTVLGAGLLVGTALAVIIPEGIHAMSIATEQEHHEHEKQETKDKEHAHEGTEASHHHEHSMIDDHSLIGITLVSGFIFMLLIDQIGGGGHIHAPADTDLPTTNSSQNRHKITATLGLVVHAAADGIAMGAAVSMSTAHLTLIVFVAIMLHKAPAAFGLVSFLLHEGFDRTRIRKHLFIFAAAAPIGAILTYMCLNQKSMETLNDTHTTGIAMLFSAGTFLYVATVHVLPEIASRQTRQTLQDGTVVIHEHKGFAKLDLVALVIGAVVPVILSIGHKH
ncbi:zinc transporter ZIP9-B-like isoform X2 [Ruditapes philippinarum]|uniref:zinc transporter ZIP9-B-like isoform X2 n=1 Tax=Ruditapes philippinarum TaxID=129788 RepID=UPI00295ACFDF|nr:zinc transporter ZIP9-B-like isoform X2 [Ruditapes philippinarum]